MAGAQVEYKLIGGRQEGPEYSTLWPQILPLKEQACILWSTIQYTLHYTQYTLHYTLYTLHYTLYTMHYTSSQGAGMHTVIHYTTIHSALYSAIRSTMCTQRRQAYFSELHTHYTFYTILCSIHFTLYPILLSTVWTMRRPYLYYTALSPPLHSRSGRPKHHREWIGLSVEDKCDFAWNQLEHSFSKLWRMCGVSLAVVLWY